MARAGDWIPAFAGMTVWGRRNYGLGHTRLDIYSSGGITLEGIAARPEGLNSLPPAAVLCHPHPMLGGDMESLVLSAIDWTCMHRGIASLRFNFRGVGESSGDFTNGDKELDDVKAAFRVLDGLKWADPRRMAAVGYSFGAGVLLGGVRQVKASKAFVFIAPPLSAVRDSALSKDKRPKLFIAGQKDGVVPSVELQRALDDVKQPVEFHEVPDANHGMVDHEIEVAERVADFLTAELTPDVPDAVSR